MKQIFNLLLLLGVAFPSFTQSVELTPKEVHAFRLLKASLFLSNKHGPLFFDRHIYVYKRQENGTLWVQAARNPGLSDPLVGDRYDHYVLDVNKPNYSVIQLFDDCKAEAWLTINEWDGDKPFKTTSTRFGRVIWSYNEAGQPVTMDEGRSYRRSGRQKSYRETKMNLSYDVEGRINGADKVLQVYKPSKNSSNLKEDYEYTEESIQVEYGALGTRLQVLTYRKEKRGVVLHKDQVYVLTQDAGSTVIRNTSTTMGNGQITETTSSVLNEFDSSWNLISCRRDNPDYLWTYQYTYDAGGRVVAEYRELFDKSKKEVSKAISYERTFDSRGLLMEQSETTEQPGKPRERRVISYTYSPAEGNSSVTRCEHEEENIMRFYDENDQLFKEVTAGKVRTKENGVWTNWRFMRM